MEIEEIKLKAMATHSPFSYSEIKDAYLYCNKNYETIEKIISLAQKFGLPLAILGLMTKLNLIKKEE